MKEKLIILLIVLLPMTFATGCRTIKNNHTTCYVGFDYKDKGVNDQNVKALVRHYCLCNPESKKCKDSIEK